MKYKIIIVVNDITIMKKLVDLTVKYENDLKKLNIMKKIITNKLSKKTKRTISPIYAKIRNRPYKFKSTIWWR